MTWLYILGGAAVTYAWRGLGVLLSGRIDPESKLMRWFAALAYALLAGLISRLILLPQGALSETPLLARIAAAALALLVYRWSRSSILLGVMAGTGLLMICV